VRRIFAYTVVLVAFTVVPFALGSFGLAYLVGALVFGGIFLALAAKLLRDGASRRGAALVFHYSLLYLALVFVAAAVDATV
jgi:protoheme IX farnesyltransferase